LAAVLHIAMANMPETLQLELEAAPPQQPVLTAAFSSFTEAAASLERSYSGLQAEVTRLRRELQEANEQLARRRALAEMSTLLAHEVRNPLGSLELFAGLLAQQRLNEAAQGWVEHLQAGLRSLSATVNNVLQFQNSATPLFAPLDLRSWLRRFEGFLTPLTRRSNVVLTVNADFDGVYISADGNRLQQAMLNLALNALRAMPNGGRLTIEAEMCTQRDEVILRVSDTEPAFTTAPGSPGLGLAITKAILEQHNGMIQVASRIGQGTTFELSFPLACPDGKTVSEEPASA